MDNRNFIKAVLLCLGLFALGMITAYFEGLDTSGGSYYMVRGFVSTEEKVGSSAIIAFMGLVGLFCCVILKIKDSVNNINSKKLLIGAGAIIAIAIVAVLISGSFTDSELSIPDNAVILMNSNDKNSTFTIYSNDTHEKYFIHCILNLNKIEVNGSNNYSTSPKSVIEELYQKCKEKGSLSYGSYTLNLPDDESNLNIKSLNVKFYDSNGKEISHKELNDGEFNMGKWYVSYTSKEFEGDSISSLYNESDGGYAELYMLLESNADENSADYYCYELVVPLKVESEGYML